MFYGREVSQYGKEHHRVDYATLYSTFNHILCNEILLQGEWDLVNGQLDEDDEVFQTYIIDPQGAYILREYTNDPVWYNEGLNLYVSGVTHWGTNWSYVLTDIKEV